METSGLENYKELLLFLGTAGVIVPLFGRFRVSPILGFLAAGVALGPFGLGALSSHVPWISVVSISNVGQIAHLAEFGVAFLLFMIGLELSWNRLLLMRKLVFGLGTAQVVVTSVVLALAAFLLGQTPAAAVVLGFALALSSTAIVLRSLAERKRLNSAAGRSIFAVLLLQDLAVAPLLFMIAMLGAQKGAGLGTGLAYALAPAVLGLAMLAVFGRLILRPLFQLVAAARSEELFVAACLLVVIGTGLIGAALGLPLALGAFIAGLLLAETEYSRQVEVTIHPFQGLLLGLFFVSVGAKLDLSYVFVNPALTLGVAAAFVAIKVVLLLPLARAIGLSWKVAREVALVLGPGGEFALVAVGAAVATGVVPAEAAAVTMVAATLSMFAIPLLVRVAERISTVDQSDNPDLDDLMPQLDDGAARVIIVGYGRVGRLVGEMLAIHQIPYLAIDQDVTLVTRERRDGKAIYYGDATRVEFLRRCGIANARALVVTLDVPAANEAIVAAARAERPDLTIVARARDAAHATRLYDLHVTDAVPETIEASLQLSEALLVDIGVPMGLVIASIHEKRDEFRRLLQSPNVQDRQRRGIRASTRRGPGKKK